MDDTDEEEDEKEDEIAETGESEGDDAIEDNTAADEREEAQAGDSEDAGEETAAESGATAGEEATGTAGDAEPPVEASSTEATRIDESNTDDEQSDDTDPTHVAPSSAGPPGSKAATGGWSDRSPTTDGLAVNAAVVTIGTAGEESDPTGDSLVASLEAAGHTVTARERLRGDLDGVQQSVDALVGRDDVDAVVTAGGTGIRSDELAIEAIHPLLEKALPGFGEAFRTLLFDHIGTGIVAVRSTAGIANETLVFCLPGDEQAATLAAEEIIASEVGDLVDHLSD